MLWKKNLNEINLIVKSKVMEGFGMTSTKKQTYLGYQKETQEKTLFTYHTAISE